MHAPRELGRRGIFRKGHLTWQFRASPKHGRDLRKALASHLGGPTSHVSQVISGDPQFTMEQAGVVNEFLIHSDDEAQFFCCSSNWPARALPVLESDLSLRFAKLLKDDKF